MADQNSGKPTGSTDVQSTTTVGPTITIRGKLKSDEDLVVKGRIDAEISSTKGLFLENSGVIRANMNVASAQISGILLGDVEANTKIEIAADGRMIGDMLAPRIVIHDGAAFRGKIDMPNFGDPFEGDDGQGFPRPVTTSQPGTDTPAADDTMTALPDAEPGSSDLPDANLAPSATWPEVDSSSEAWTETDSTAAAWPDSESTSAPWPESSSSLWPDADETPASDNEGADSETEGSTPSSTDEPESQPLGLFSFDKNKKRDS